jgi:hypothetical protein
VAEQTVARAAEIGLAVHLLPAWYDVDKLQPSRPAMLSVFAVGVAGTRIAEGSVILWQHLAENSASAPINIPLAAHYDYS